MRNAVEERLQRLLAIMAGVAGRGPVPLDELCARYDVSRRQLQSDLRLAQFMGIPPYDLPGETPEVIFHGDAVEVWVPPHFARQPTLTRPEAFAVLAAGRAALAVDPELDALSTAMRKLAEALKLAGDVEIDIDEPEFLDRVRAAVETRNRLEIAYWSNWRDELSTRRIDPLHVVFVEGAWQLLAQDHLSGEHRRFRVDRIVECLVTGERFEPSSFEPINAAFDPPPSATAVTVRFPAEARWVTEYVDADVIEDESPDAGRGDYTAVITSVGDSWLARLLLRTGGQVLEPAELRGLPRETAIGVLARYETAGRLPPSGHC